jgi:hypothetical protein
MVEPGEAGFGGASHGAAWLARMIEAAIGRLNHRETLAKSVAKLE